MSYLIKIDGVEENLDTSEEVWEEEMEKNGISIDDSYEYLDLYAVLYAVKDRYNIIGPMSKERIDSFGTRILKLNSIVPDKYGKVKILERFGFSQGALFRIPYYKEQIPDKKSPVDLDATIKQLKKDLQKEADKKNQKSSTKSS